MVALATACDEPVDYLAFGPVFGTQSKESEYSPRGMEMLREIVSQVAPRPVVAIGGITSGNLAQVIGAYIEDGEKTVRELELAHGEENAERLYRAAHSLKSQSATVGAVALSELSRELEERGREGRLEGTRERVDRIRAEYDRVLPALRALAEGGRTDRPT